MPCSPRSSTGCCTCRAQGRRAEQTVGSLPRPPPAPRATHSRESWGRGGLGASGHPIVTRTLSLDQASSDLSLIMLLTCSRGVYGSLVLTGTKVNSAQCSKTLPYPVPASLAHGAPIHPCPSPRRPSPLSPELSSSKCLPVLPLGAFPWMEKPARGGQILSFPVPVSPRIKQGEDSAEGVGCVALVPHQVSQGLSISGQVGWDGHSSRSPLTCHC